MKHNAIVVVGLILLLVYPVLAQTVPAPPQQPQTTSIDSLIQSIKDLQKEVQGLRQDLQEVKVQLQDAFANNASKLLLYLTAFFLSFYAFTRIVSRFYGWLAYRGKKREMDDLNTKMAGSLQSVIGELMQFKAVVLEMQESLMKMDSQLAELRFHVGIVKPKKSGIVEKLMFWKRS